MPQPEPKLPIATDRLMKADEARALLGVSEATFKRMLRQGRLQRVIPNQRGMRFRLSDVQKLIAEGAPESAA
jgi:excisionase family DNA binding protein